MKAQLVPDTTNAFVASLSTDHWPTLLATASRLGATVLSADLVNQESASLALQQLGSALALPEWYGANFDALADCLSDPEWQSGAKGLVLLIRGLDTFRQKAPAEWETLLEVLKSVAEARGGDGKPFWIIVDTPAPTLPAFA